MTKKRILVIIFIFIVAFILRVWNLSSIPSSLSIDEVTFGYAGYSVLHTGRDEYGRFLPLFFEGVGDFKPPVDVYLNALNIFVFGLNEFAIRIDGVLLGALTCVAVIFLLKEFGLTLRASLFGGFWLAVSGWHIFYSRAGYESITAAFFLVMGTWLFMRGIRLKRKVNIFSSFIAFSLSVWSYHAERIFVPLLFLFLVIYFRKDLVRIFNAKKDYLFSFLSFSIFVVPFIYLFIFSEGISARAVNLWLANDPFVASKLGNGIISDIGVVANSFVGQYLNYFNLKFLFWDGLNLSFKGFQGVGIFSLVDIPLFIVGIYQLIKLKEKKLKILLFVWLFLIPLPGAFARGEASSIRALVGIPFFAAFMGLGFEEVGRRFKYSAKFIVLYGLLVLLGLFYFFDMYTRVFPKYNADIWNYGYKEVAQHTCDNYMKYSKVIVTDKYGIELPNIKTVPHYYILFHCGISPAIYLNEKELYNISVRQPQWRIDMKLNNALLIGSRWDFPENFDMSKVIKTIYFSNGKAAFYFVETEK